ncbi:MAG: ureidoglycolate lyase [Rubrimonas sp.]|uniref:ureidoglycolate lyase n=1 Tax=Rubrimonas sp. TaxID=2036015 RepID=UPI002FDEFAE2
MTPVALRPEPLTAEAFAPFGAVIEATGPARSINSGFTDRFHALAFADPGPEGAAILSIFRGRRRPPLLGMLERHPLASQAFVPLSPEPWLLAVAPAGLEHPTARDVRLFAARGDQGAQYARGVWHHPLLVLAETQDFLVVDREGQGGNLDEIALNPPALAAL